MKSILKVCILFVLLLLAVKSSAQIEHELLLEDMLENPLPLTENNLIRLQQFHFLDSIQVLALTALLRTNHFKSYYQLQGLNSFDSLEIKQLTAITYIDATSQAFSIKAFTEKENYNGTLIVRLSLPGFTWLDHVYDTTTGEKYNGNQLALQQKFQIQCNDHLKLTINSSKDRGEALGFTEKQKGIDFLTVSLFYQAKSPIQKVAIGAYQFQWGQGLQLWTSRAMGRSIDLLQSVRMSQGLQSYNGSDEQRYLNGFAFAYRISAHEFFALCSRKLIDVPTVRDSSALQFGTITSSGLHRNSLEVQRKKQLQEYLLGAAWQYKKPTFQMGSMLLYQGYAVGPHTDSLGQRFLEINPTHKLSAGLQFKGNFRQSYYFFEGVQLLVLDQSFKHANALVSGVLLHLHPKLQLGFHLRYYGLVYGAFYEQGFHAKSTAQNETGIFLNLTYRVRKKINWQTYLDQFSYPHLTLVNYPQTHALFRSQLNYSHSKVTKLQLSVQKTIGQNACLFRLEGQTVYGRQLTLHAGLQISSVKYAQKGYSTFFTLKYQQLGHPWRVNFHLGSFMVPVLLNPHYQMNYHIGFGSTTLQLSGQGYFIQTTLEHQMNQKIRLGLRVLWLYKNAVFEPEHQLYIYNALRQNLQLDLQFKYQF